MSWPFHPHCCPIICRPPVHAPSLSAAGLLIAASSLLEWGCPPALVLQLLDGSLLPQQLAGGPHDYPTLAATGATSCSSSRPALLVLVWLVAHVGVFQRHLQQLQASLDRLPWLPPWPQVRPGATYRAVTTLHECFGMGF